MTKWDDIFRRKLQQMWDDVLALTQTTVDQDLVEKSLKSIALSFYHSFEESLVIHVSFSKDLFERYHSVRLELGKSCLSLPHYFHEVAQENPPPKLDHVFQKNLPWVQLVSLLLEGIYRHPKKLRPSDVSILQALSNYSLQLSSHSLPFVVDDLVSLVDKRRLAWSTVDKGVKDLYRRKIVRPSYFVNPWAFDLELQVTVRATTEERHQEERWGDWTWVREPFFSGNTLRISAVPGTRSETEWTTTDASYSGVITQFTASANIGALSHRSEKSFQETPVWGVQRYGDPTMLKFTHNSSSLLDLLSAEKGLEGGGYSHILQNGVEARFLKAGQVLDYISRVGITDRTLEKIAKVLGIHRNELAEFLRLFAENHFIAFFPRFNYLNASSRYFVHLRTWEDQATWSKEAFEQVQLFRRDCLELPLTFLYEAVDSLSVFVSLPEKWVGSWLGHLALLRSLDQFALEFTPHTTLYSEVVPPKFPPKASLTRYGTVEASKEVFKNLGCTYK